MNTVPKLGGIFAALMVSCLLHVALLVLLMNSARTGGDVGSGGHSSNSVGIIRGKLIVSDKTPDTISMVGHDSGAQSKGGLSENSVAPEPRSPGSSGAHESDLLPMKSPLFYDSKQLTKRPHPSIAVELDTPEMSSMNASGSIVLKLWINERGNVVSLAVEKTELPEPVLATAIKVFKNLHFEPGEINGDPVGSVLRIEIDYELGGQ